MKKLLLVMSLVMIFAVRIYGILIQSSVRHSAGSPVHDERYQGRRRRRQD